jgi:hypothetical protein
MGNTIRPVAASARGTTSEMTVSGATDEAMAEPIAKGLKSVSGQRARHTALECPLIKAGLRPASTWSSTVVPAWWAGSGAFGTSEVTTQSVQS